MYVKTRGWSCVKTGFYKRCEACLEAVSQHFGTSLLNKITWTVGKKLSASLWQIQTSYALKLLWQLPCLCILWKCIQVFCFFTFLYLLWMDTLQFFHHHICARIYWSFFYNFYHLHTDHCTFMKILIKMYICYLVFTFLLEHSQEPNKVFF
jgi:hypothetical protein